VIVKEPESTFEPAPAGMHLAVCVDVVDLGVVETHFGAKAQMRLVWQLDERMDDGKPYVVMQRYKPSLHEKAKLRQHLESWRGRPFTRDELAGFDLENLIGVPCQINVVHKETERAVYANIAAITPPYRGAELAPDWSSYTRVKDRAEDDTGYREPSDDLDDLPF